MIKGEYLMWGAGTYGKRFIEFMKDELTCKAVIDHNIEKQGGYFEGLPVISFLQAKEEYPNAKIIITQAYPNVTRDFLANNGYKEYSDFFSIYDFVPRWYKENYDKLAVMVANFSPSSICTLSCDGCQSFIPYLKRGRVIPISQMKEDADLLFSNLDKVFLINICLGESFTNKELSQFTKYVFERYREQYGNMVVLTNGTIVPSDEEMKGFVDSNAIISISDYRDVDSRIEKSLHDLIEKCKCFGIRYYLNTSSDKSIWFDFGNPLEVTATDSSTLKQRYRRCFKCGSAVRDGKLYLCEAQNAAIAVAKAPEPEEGDYYDLHRPITKQTREELYKIIARAPDKGYISQCARCNGTTPVFGGAKP
ncbi:hypothetical protein LJC27_04210 [Christensenellaceae bacterium OttesenSCG-928-M15]|nr:hypothetical protein [Christensenellaceae bacterium OttesenSCG-928-M15]